MSRYIDAHFAQLIADEELDSSGKGTVCWVLAHTPNADVVEAVRCKDCVVPHNQWTGCPKLNGLVTSPDFYCSYGERRKEDEEK